MRYLDKLVTFNPYILYIILTVYFKANIRRKEQNFQGSCLNNPAPNEKLEGSLFKNVRKF